MTSLQDRVREATGPDRELDAAICKALDPVEWAQACQAAEGPHGAPSDVIERDAGRYTPAYTASPDAALALVERVLPGWTHWTLSRGCEGYYVKIAPRSWNPNHDQDATDVGGVMVGQIATPALALLAALLTATDEDRGERDG